MAPCVQHSLQPASSNYQPKKENARIQIKHLTSYLSQVSNDFLVLIIINLLHCIPREKLS